MAVKSSFCFAEYEKEEAEIGGLTDLCVLKIIK